MCLIFTRLMVLVPRHVFLVPLLLRLPPFVAVAQQMSSAQQLRAHVQPRARVKLGSLRSMLQPMTRI
jgi:hypothetical protein